MRCNKFLQSQIPALASGELSPIRAWRLRRHLKRCALCSAEWGRVQALLSGLYALNSEPPGETLRSRVLASLPAFPQDLENEAPLLRGKEKPRMKKIGYAMVCVLMLVAITGVIASQLWHFRPLAGFSDRSGAMWWVESGFKGEVRIYDAAGNRVGSTVSDSGDVQAQVTIRTQGRSYSVTGLGRHELHSPDGRLVGSAVISLLTEQEFLQRSGWPRMPRSLAEAAEWSEKNDGGGSSGVTASIWGIRGFDHHFDLSWKMQGRGRVQVLTPDGQKMGDSVTPPMPPDTLAQLPPQLAADAARTTPVFLLTVHGKTTQVQGFGLHPLVDENGRTLLVLKAEPLPGEAPSR